VTSSLLPSFPVPCLNLASFSKIPKTLSCGFADIVRLVGDLSFSPLLEVGREAAVTLEEGDFVPLPVVPLDGC